MIIKYQRNSLWRADEDIPDLKPDDYRISQRRAGGYEHLVLDELKTPYIATVWSPEDDKPEDWVNAERLLNMKNLFLGFMRSGDLYTVTTQEPRKLSDLGLSLLIDEKNKTTKRAMSIVSAKRLGVHRGPEEDPFKVLVVPGGKTLDGWGVVSKRLVIQAIETLSFPGFRPVQRAMLIRYLETLPIMELRLIGRWINIETGLNPLAMIKGNFAVRDLPPDIDVVTPDDNVKFELSGTTHGWLLLEPKNTKLEAYNDQQTWVNNPDLQSMGESRQILAMEEDKAFHDLKNLKLMARMRDLTKAEYSKDFSWDGDKLDRTLDYNANKVALYGLPYTVSPWLTQEIGNIWVRSLQKDNPRKARVFLPCAVRGQVISSAAAWLAGFDIKPKLGELRWCPQLQVMVAHNFDWEYIIVPTHGGCDLDDLFVIRWRTVGGKRKIVITRSPNNRGERSEWDYHEGDWYPEYVTANGKVLTFPVQSIKMRPPQILEAGVEFIDLPSKANPPEPFPLRPYSKADVVQSIRETATVVGGYGTYEIAVRIFNSLSRTWVDTQQIRSEDAIDAYAIPGPLLDREFIAADIDRIYTNVINSGRKVDPVLAGRSGRDDLLVGETGPVERLHVAIHLAADRHTERVEKWTNTFEIPDWLRELGRNEFYATAERWLKRARWEHWRSDTYWKNQMPPIPKDLPESKQKKMSAEQRRFIHKKNREATDAYLLPLFEAEKRGRRDMVAMAFWYAARTVPTSTGLILTDQIIFGTSVLDYVLDALVYYGVVGMPYINEMGHLRRRRQVWYLGPDQWRVRCVNCGVEAIVDRAGLTKYRIAKGICRNCKGRAS